MIQQTNVRLMKAQMYVQDSLVLPVRLTNAKNREKINDWYEWYRKWSSSLGYQKLNSVCVTVDLGCELLCFEVLWRWMTKTFYNLK